MTIAEEKVKASSQRFMLIKAGLRKYIGSDLTLDSGVIYTMEEQNVVGKVERNGVELTNVSSSSVSADEWYYDDVSKVLYVGLSSAPDDSTNVVVSSVNLYLTGEKTRYVNEDPLDSATTVREWEAKVVRYPDISETVKNVTSGVFTISAFSFTVIDTDRAIKSLLTPDATFNNADVEVWSAINDQYKKVYVGKIRSVRIDLNQASFNVYDDFSRLQDTATLGDLLDGEVFADKTSYPNIDPDKERDPIPAFFGKFTRAQYRWGATERGLQIAGYHLAEGNEGINFEFFGVRDSSFNRKFILGRVGPNGVADQNLGTITAVDHVAGAFSGAFPTFTTSGHNVRVGDCFKIVTSSAREYFCKVSLVTSTSFSVSLIDSAGDFQNFTLADPAGDQILPSSTYTTGKAVQVTIKRGQDTNNGITERDIIFLGYDQQADFITETTTASGGKLVTLDISKEGGVPYTEAFNPDVDKLIFSMTLNDDYPHESVVETLITSSGLEVDSASITQAGLDLDTECMFQIPLAKSRRLESYQKYLERILASTLGVVYLNDDLQVGYRILTSPSSGDPYGEDNANSITSRIDFNDVVTSIRLSNRHYSNLASELNNDGVSPNSLLEDNKAKYLNRTEKVKEIEHVMFDVNWAQRVIDLLSKRKAQYSFSVAAEAIEANIADDITFSSNIIIGSLQDNLTITSLKKSPDRITIMATDLEGL